MTGKINPQYHTKTSQDKQKISAKMLLGIVAISFQEINCAKRVPTFWCVFIKVP